VKAKLRLDLIKTLKPSKTRYTVWDTEDRGLGLEVLPGGGLTWWYRYSRFGKPDKVRLGSFPALTLDSAKSKIRYLKGQKDEKGVDPGKVYGPGKDPITIEDLAKRFEKEHLPRLKPSTRRCYKQNLRKHIVPALGHILVGRLAESDVKHMHRDMINIKTTANACVDVLSSMMLWAEGEGFRNKKTNPRYDIEKYLIPPRQHYLSETGYQEVVEKLNTVKASPYAIGAVRLIMLTGMRKGEVMDLLWDWVDLEAENPQIRIPYEYHKTGKTMGDKVIFLAPDAVELLKQTKKWKGIPRVFPGANALGRCWAIDRLWRQIRKDEKFSNLVIHDLRHSFASTNLNHGMGLEDISRLLGHSTTSVTQRYAHISAERSNELAQKAGGIMAGVMKPKKKPE
jgi:integrase